MDDGERGFLWLEAESDMLRLSELGILYPVLIDSSDKLGVKVVAYVPQTAYRALLSEEYPFIKAFEDHNTKETAGTFFFN